MRRRLLALCILSLLVSSPALAGPTGGPAGPATPELSVGDRLQDRRYVAGGARA